MQKIYVAAGALLLGTSVLAYAADKEAAPLGESIAETTVQSIDAAKPDPIEAYADTKGAASQSDASLALAPSGEPMSKSALGEPVSAKLETGAYAESSDAIAQSKLALASAKMDPAVPVQSQAAVGGPFEEANATNVASLAPRPAAQNYPACEPGPGDDSCIQLYETGVRTQLASWDAPTGGFADESATAMGGPFEPVDGHADASAKLDGDSAMNDRMIDTSVAEPQGVPLGYAAPEGARLDAAEPAIDASHQGVGGPVVSQSGYPPCEPGAGDDRCIQLYERGVTGDGN
jgi:hypothetical protein